MGPGPAATLLLADPLTATVLGVVVPGETLAPLAVDRPRPRAARLRSPGLRPAPREARQDPAPSTTDPGTQKVRSSPSTARGGVGGRRGMARVVRARRARARHDRPAVARRPRDHVQVEVEDGLEGDSAVAHQHVDARAARMDRRSARARSDRPTRRAGPDPGRGPRTGRYDEQVAARDRVEVEERDDRRRGRDAGVGRVQSRSRRRRSPAMRARAVPMAGRRAGVPRELKATVGARRSAGRAWGRPREPRVRKYVAAARLPS